MHYCRRLPLVPRLLPWSGFLMNTRTQDFHNGKVSPLGYLTQVFKGNLTGVPPCRTIYLQEVMMYSVKL